VRAELSGAVPVCGEAGACVSLARSRHVLLQPGKAHRLEDRQSSCTEMLLPDGQISNFCSFEKTNPTIFFPF